MAIIGFIVCVLFMLWLTGMTVFSTFFGGEEFSPINLKQHGWKLAIMVFCLGIGWRLLIDSAPFTIAINTQ